MPGIHLSSVKVVDMVLYEMMVVMVMVMVLRVTVMVSYDREILD